MAIFGNSVGNIIVTAVVTWTLQRRVALATRLLKGLKCYHITAAGSNASKTVPTDSKNTPIPRPTKQQAAKAKKRENDLGEANAVTTVPLSVAQIESTAFYSYLDLTVLAVPAALANYLTGEIQQALGFPGNFLPALAGAILIGLALRALLHVTLLTELSPTFDKACTAGFAVLSGSAALAVLTMCPQGILSFDTKTAAQTLSQASGALLRNKATTEAGKHLPDPSIDPLYLEVALALLGAALGGLLLTPIMRITRSFAAAMNPPEWARDQLTLSPWHTLTLHLNLILPAIATVIWLTPLFQEPLDVPAAWLAPIKAAVLLCIALVQVVNTRSLVQSYLNSGLKQWHDMKHGPPAGAAGTKTGEAITLRLRIVNMLLVKVAIQCIAPAIVLTGCAIILLQHSNDANSHTDAKSESAQMLQIPISFWVCIAEFCGWWTCTCWFLYGAGLLTLIKSNLLQA